MNLRAPKVESFLELGFVLFAVALVGAVLVLFLSGASTGLSNRAGRAQKPPQRGSISPESHINVQAVATR